MANKIFDAATSELSPTTNLIEASAGTGKTYTIAMLVLRLVVERALSIENILLVTFTRAATEELAGRIRKRFIEARDLLSGAAVETQDNVLIEWRATLADEQLALFRIHAALNDIDRAAIFTIHGFCQRMLQDQALESGQLFDVELRADIDPIKNQIAKDYWRKNLYALTPLQCSVITSVIPSPDMLLRSIRTSVALNSVVEPEATERAVNGAEVEQYHQEMIDWWRKNSHQLHDLLEGLVIEKKLKSGFSKDFTAWWQDVDEFFNKKSLNVPKKLDQLTQSGFIDVINGTRVRGAKKNELLDMLNLPDSQITSFLQAGKELVMSIRIDFAKSLPQRLESWMQSDNIMSYNDLIFRLHRAVTGSDGPNLRKILRKRFKAALIDEFQDTDIAQWQIFKKVFGSTYLYLIGDPKQAIYRFRGADINSYFIAKKTADHELTLDKNYRSHPGLVDEINRLFSTRKNPFVLEESNLAFFPVKPALTKSDGLLHKNGEPLENQVYCQLLESSESKDGRWSSGKAGTAILKFVVNETIALLDGDVIISEKDEQRILAPSDIAILVRNNSHAAEYLECFSRAGIPAVITSRKSIFETEECQDLYILMKSLAQPGQLQLMKRAMSIKWLGYSGNDLYSIWRDDDLFDRWFARFQSYSETWNQKGFLVMMNSFLDDQEVFVKLGATPLAERSFANINQLLEVIQQAETAKVFSPVQTLQWLRNNMQTVEKENELRLESDEDAVRIVTMHAAKGLQYPVVFCPYLWYRQARIETENNCIVSMENGVEVVDLGSARFEERRKKVAREEFAEDLRLLYVAVTRAQLRCYTIWCDIKGRSNGPVDSFISPLGYLLFPDGPVGYDEQKKRLQSFVHDRTVGYLEIGKEETKSSYKKEVIENSLNLRKATRSSLHTNWQMTSYSALASMSDHEERQNTDFSGMEDSKLSEFSSLPAGANFGNVVHDIFEKVSFLDLRTPENHRFLIQQICDKYGVEPEITLLEKMLKNVVDINLSHADNSTDSDMSLAALDDEKCIKEMMFYFHLERGETVEINRILAGEETVSNLGEKTIEGYLTGFIDLVYEHDKRFYIVDYKSNKLGDRAADYRAEFLTAAMRAHNYGLQYWLYSLVLHRHLTNFLPGYDYTKHFGGVYYLFVRGMEKESGNGIFYYRPDLGTLLRLDRCLGGGDV